MAMISATEQNVTDVVEDGVAELAEGQGALGRKIDALRITEMHAKEGRARARQDKDRAIGRELRLDWIADTPFGAGGFGSVFMAK